MVHSPVWCTHLNGALTCLAVVWRGWIEFLEGLIAHTASVENLQRACAIIDRRSFTPNDSVSWICKARAQSARRPIAVVGSLTHVSDVVRLSNLFCAVALERWSDLSSNLYRLWAIDKRDSSRARIIPAVSENYVTWLSFHNDAIHRPLIIVRYHPRFPRYCTLVDNLAACTLPTTRAHLIECVGNTSRLGWMIVWMADIK